MLSSVLIFLSTFRKSCTFAECQILVALCTTWNQLRVDNIFLILDDRKKKKVRDVIHDMPQIKDYVIQCTEFVMCPSEVMEFCRMSKVVVFEG